MNEKPEKIIKAAIELIAENGFHNSPTSLISKRAGVGVGTIYRYFANKEKLIEEAHHYVRDDLMESVFKTDDKNLPARDRFIRLFTNMYQYLLNNKSHNKFFEQFYNSPFGMKQKRIGEDFMLFEEFFHFLKNQQLIKDMDNELLIALALGPLLFVLNEHFTGYIIADQKAVDKLVVSSWDAVKL
ncbi:MAG: TetR/AcrR family transcriptional regulator [Proteobacteria bacterium]|nr:TetR/AcrR family transcriptional regulator [Pseudomonadota bacterium]